MEEPLSISFVIPVFNRPDEIGELLESITKLKGNSSFEIVIVDDGSTLKSNSVAELYQSRLEISYFFKSNSGPGDSRNYGMRRAKGNYFIILDSDCILPENYLETVVENMERQYVDCFGGPDAAHVSFSHIQKAINFAMTSFMTTGGIRGGDKRDFQPRSFNMGISKEAFETSKGFGTIHPGEDPDLSIRLGKLGYNTALFSDAFVYHKRRVSWTKFYQQVYKFGLVRPILNRWHPEKNKVIYWLPTLFSVGLILSIIFFMFNIIWPLLIYIIYFVMAFVVAWMKTKNLSVAIQSIFAILIQFLGYGYGFLLATLKLLDSKKSAEQQFPNLFFKHVQ